MATSPDAWKKGDRSCTCAYLLAICCYGGFFGLHHLYLGRPLQAGLWACTGGGFFGAGLLFDLFKIPFYASVRNCDPRSQEQLDVEMKYNKVPPWRLSRMFFALCIGKWFRLVGSGFGLDFFPAAYFRVVQAVAGALGVWLVGSACTHQGGSFQKTLAGSFIGEFMLGGYASLAALFAFQWSRFWQPEAKKRRPKLWQVLLAVCFFWSAALGGFLQHGSITVKTQEGPTTFRVKDCLWNIVSGMDWEDIRASFNEESSSKDWKEKFQGRWESLKSRFDVQGERRALKTLGMETFIGKAYTEDDVKQHFKKMAKIWHPDKVAPDQKKEAERKMQEINSAKEVLDGISSSRGKKKR